ncbi:MAG: tripartite tricarboxylate transporter TctB family protein [Hyphomicrobiaceae bacterium]|nr:tripartite tricarboxylate transporter TctB family protein [Hyphomicrobiaceae bacterium]
MTVDHAKPKGRLRWWVVLQGKNVLSGLLFIGVALCGLWISQDYPVGTMSRMGTGYMPRLLLWILLGLGGLILASGLWQADQPAVTDASPGAAWRPVVFVTLSLVVFGLSLERLGLVLSILLLTGIGAAAGRGMRLLETAIAALVLVALCWLIFIVGLSLTIPVWPGF